MTSFVVSFFFSSRRRHTRWNCDWSQTCALPISHFPAHGTFRKDRPAGLVLVRRESDVRQREARTRLDPERACNRTTGDVLTSTVVPSLAVGIANLREGSLSSHWH